MGQFDTGNQILAHVLERAGSLGASDNDYANKAKTYIQTAYVTLVGRYPWPWAKKIPKGSFVTVPEIATGTVAVVSGNNAVTFSSPPAVSVAGRLLRVENQPACYQIATHSANNATAVLDSAFTGNNASAASYSVFQPEYSLGADFLAPLNNQQLLVDATGGGHLATLSEEELWERFPVPGTPGTPAYAARVAHPYVHLEPPPATARRYEYAYIAHPGTLTFDNNATTDVPIVQPPEDRVVLVFLALANLLTDIDDDRADVFAQSAEQRTRLMMATAGRGASAPRRYVRLGPLGRPR